MSGLAARRKPRGDLERPPAGPAGAEQRQASLLRTREHIAESSRKDGVTRCGHPHSRRLVSRALGQSVNHCLVNGARLARTRHLQQLAAESRLREPTSSPRPRPVVPGHRTAEPTLANSESIFRPSRTRSLRIINKSSLANRLQNRRRITGSPSERPVFRDIRVAGRKPLAVLPTDVVNAADRGSVSE